MSRLVLIYCVLNSFYFTLYGCQGQVYPPSNQSMIVVLPGTSARIIWTFVGDPSQATLSWFFTKRAAGSTEEEIAVKFRTNNPIISSRSLPGVAIEDPATLVLMNVNDSYNGEYRFDVTVVGGGGESSVEFFVAETPKISINCSSVTTVNQGDYFACECIGTDGNPPANITWYKDNTQTVKRKEKAVLVFSNVDKDDNGTYRCAAKSHKNVKNETSMELIVIQTPKISINCSSVTTVNQSDYFACKCKGTDGNPPANVTWYKNNAKIVTGIENATLRYPDVKKNASGMHKCVAKSGIEEAKNETKIELIVNYLPKNVNLKLTRSGQSATITCSAEAHPEPSFKIFFNCGMMVASVKTYTIAEVNSSHDGVYQCVAENILGQRSSVPIYLPPVEPSSPPKTTLPQKTSQTITNGNGTDKTCLDNMTSGTEWYITVVTLVCGIIVGILLSYIAHCSRRRWFRKSKPKRNPSRQPTEADSAYQELDLSKMNKEDNYQSLRGNVAITNEVTNDDDTENYTELSKTRDAEDNYQSLT